MTSSNQPRTTGWSRRFEEADVVGGALELLRLNAVPELGWQSVGPLTSLPVSMDYLPHAIGANMGFRTAVYIALDGCDEAYHVATEDVEICWRAQLAGYRLAFAKDAVVHYRLRKTLRGLARQTFAQLYRAYEHQVPVQGWWRVEFWRWRHLVATIGLVRHRDTAGRWMFDAAWNAGRIVVSIRERRLCP